MKTLVRLFLSLVCVAAGAVLYVLLGSHAGLQPCCRATGQPGSPSAPAVLSFQGYSRVPDGKPLERALCRRCAIVSSSGQMLGSGLGQAIDGQECVLRMNHAPTAGYERDVGSRSTVRVVSHTSVPLLLRNQPYFFQQSQETLYVIWGPARKMSREKVGPTYQMLLKVMETYPQLQVYTLTEEKMTYCDDIFQNETGKNRMKSGSFLSTGWFTMILAMELCEQICVFGMVSDSYCSREKNHSSVPYHYFEKGRLDECKMYLVHERARRAGHRFITEKAIFSRWAKRRNINFTHPSWAGG
ncbi:alpha-N-acetyl-neuraminyl-2,3-beta-galactosyl-1,3-N-acetyl-galactosaminide alpha-2,6-sialyltransferase isoform X1 [Colius striatus]|uniref:alpha-N-acetyl-neuraminyl-2,3-beta-galactosyl-1, 3-N-acetyl-galactosaminide alpha-2,6-sialyltransferase isoform X1 n=1 Tax=Colius striatus TaxID=57412 RepID=UPI002B1D5F5A|nr:alpha-N-acetyl-neuraminyl-2,3-beta-galactosyl-1,3-N-acetyl-galactosaminide alpha-2,6-sialyltransferase isoform X1 [Colius striatus]XP_061867526.1 alpha-N-acetyl-neuraminyl-2,3-beta-galactosyl-1,3-N-acetyl-galactosaminide alpha-2,6-sialyltransferase isoform X1 [Colius striatus]XP_061867527.1 alpha-N-acetyl-neuraminyl-2,3-beta-galactosyl-1,3-N-acetyl-galactosaminide alpha-2,6-sialyltransferase isoform X1 [Colius striatus]